MPDNSTGWSALVNAVESKNELAIHEAVKIIIADRAATEVDHIHDVSLNGILTGTSQGIQGESFLTTIVEGLSSALPKAIGEWWKKYTEDSEREYQTKLDPIYLDMKQKGIITQDMQDTITAAAKDKPIWGGIMRWLSIFAIYISYFQHKMAAITSEANQMVNKQYRPNLPGPGDIIRAAFIAPEKTGYVRERLERIGYKDEDIDLMFISQYGTYTVDEAFRLWLRGVLTDQDLVKRLREHGLTDVKINELKQLYAVIPPLGDIFTMLAKEAFEPDQIAKFGLADEYPSHMEVYAKAHGLSSDWSKRFWYAHWNHASPGQVLEMLHRGLIDEADVYQYYRVIEIPPYWRNLLTQISYTPYARVDTRRMYSLGVLDQEAVYKTYRDEGYDHDHATKLTQFTVAVKVEAQKDLTKAQMLDAFKIGLVTKESCIAFLKDLGYDDAESLFQVEYVQYKEDLKDLDEVIKMIGERYKNGMIDQGQATELLTNMQLSAQQIDRYINIWDSARFKGRRRLTKNELGEMVLNEIITPTEYVYEMTELGYDERHITWALQLLFKPYGGVAIADV